MKATVTWMASGAFFAMTAVAAQADCAAELARLTEGGAASEGISKDGSLAPLEGASDAAAGTAPAATDAPDTAETADMNGAAPTPDTATAEGGDGIAKDGSLMPLEDASGQQAGVAMSGADAQAQQEGLPTAAEQAAGAGAGDSTRDAHIQAARDALAAGDEDACMAAVQAAQSS